MPVTEAEVAETLAAVPEHFLSGLRAVFLLGGSRRQELSSGRLFVFGRYGSGCVFLHAFPLARMREKWRSLPKPSVRREYERAGATWEQKADGWVRVFTAESLRAFYLRDVLIHEIGHHIDRFSQKDRRASESFATWVASEFGYAKSKVAT